MVKFSPFFSHRIKIIFLFWLTSLPFAPVDLKLFSGIYNIMSLLFVRHWILPKILIDRLTVTFSRHMYPQSFLSLFQQHATFEIWSICFDLTNLHLLRFGNRECTPYFIEDCSSV